MIVALVPRAWRASKPENVRPPVVPAPAPVIVHSRLSAGRPCSVSTPAPPRRASIPAKVMPPTVPVPTPVRAQVCAPVRALRTVSIPSPPVSVAMPAKDIDRIPVVIGPGASPRVKGTPMTPVPAPVSVQVTASKLGEVRLSAPEPQRVSTPTNENRPPVPSPTAPSSQLVAVRVVVRKVSVPSPPSKETSAARVGGSSVIRSESSPPRPAIASRSLGARKRSVVVPMSSSSVSGAPRTAVAGSSTTTRSTMTSSPAVPSRTKVSTAPSTTVSMPVRSMPSTLVPPSLVVGVTGASRVSARPAPMSRSTASKVNPPISTRLIPATTYVGARLARVVRTSTPTPPTTVSTFARRTPPLRPVPATPTPVAITVQMTWAVAPTIRATSSPSPPSKKIGTSRSPPVTSIVR